MNKGINEWIKGQKKQLRVSMINKGIGCWIEENENELTKLWMNWISVKKYTNELRILRMNEGL